MGVGTVTADKDYLKRLTDEATKERLEWELNSVRIGVVNHCDMNFEEFTAAQQETLAQMFVHFWDHIRKNPEVPL
jgi:hypothetical protein